MSGVFLTVWNDADRERSPVLRTTRGGYPHITCIYLGAADPVATFKRAAARCAAAIGVPLVLRTARVTEYEKAGAAVFDVRLCFDAPTAIVLCLLHAGVARDLGRAPDAAYEPHVTHGIYADRAAAEAAAAAVQPHLPYTVAITGVAVD